MVTASRHNGSAEGAKPRGLAVARMLLRFAIGERQNAAGERIDEPKPLVADAKTRTADPLRDARPQCRLLDRLRLCPRRNARGNQLMVLRQRASRTPRQAARRPDRAVTCAAKLSIARVSLDAPANAAAMS